MADGGGVTVSHSRSSSSSSGCNLFYCCRGTSITRRPSLLLATALPAVTTVSAPRQNAANWFVAPSVRPIRLTAGARPVAIIESGSETISTPGIGDTNNMTLVKYCLLVMLTSRSQLQAVLFFTVGEK